MPHSSGGGSHGGGHHSGGSHRSSSSRSHSSSSSSYSSPSVKVSNKEYAGSTKYVYYGNGGKMHYVYSSSSITPPDLVGTIVGDVIFAFIFGIIAYFILIFSVYKPTPLDTSSYKSGVNVYDFVGIIEEEKLTPSLNEFLDETGVSPAIEVVTESQWKGKYKDLETLAYSEYLRFFDDEKHWLIVVSYPDDYKTSDFVEWEWEGMIGDDCYPAINSKQTDVFGKIMQKNMLRSDPDKLDEYLASAFSEFSSVAMKRQTSVIGVAFFVVLTGAIILVVVISLLKYRKHKLVYKAHRVTKTAKEMNCTYCGRLYVTGTVQLCPSCGAPIPAYNGEETNS